MKPLPSAFFALIGAALLSSPVAATSATFDVVATRTGASHAPPASEQGLVYVLVDGGSVIYGDVLAGDPPPEPATVASELREHLAAKGWRAAQPGEQPDLLLVSHLGASFNEPGYSMAGTRLSRADRQARLQRVRLLRGRPGSAEVEAALISSRDTNVGNFNFSEEGRQMSRAIEDERYFVILAAYDYREVRDGQPQLLWRTKASQPVRGTLMKPALQAAAQLAVAALGEDHGAKAVAFSAKPPSAAGQAADGGLTSTDVAGLGLPPAVVERLVRDERADTLGLRELPFEQAPRFAEAAR